MPSYSFSRSTDTTTIQPILVLDGFMAVDEGQSIVHRVVGKSAPDITLRPAEIGTGSMKLLFATYAAAAAARVFFRAAAIFSSAVPTMPWLPATFIMVRCTREQQTARGRWLIEVTYQETAT